MVLIPPFELDDIGTGIAIVAAVTTLILFMIRQAKKLSTEVEVRVEDKQARKEAEFNHAVKDNIELIKHIQDNLSSQIENNSDRLAYIIAQQKEVIDDIKKNIDHLSNNLDLHINTIAKTSAVLDTFVYRLNNIESTAMNIAKKTTTMMSEDE